MLLATWFFFLALLFAAVVVFVELCGGSWKLLRGREGTRSSLLFAYQATTLAGNLYLALSGAGAWFSFGPFASEGARAAGDLYADVPYVHEHVLQPLCAAACDRALADASVRGCL